MISLRVVFCTERHGHNTGLAYVLHSLSFAAFASCAHYEKEESPAKLTAHKMKGAPLSMQRGDRCALGRMLQAQQQEANCRK